jgi:diguanylate cyclase (GGDEF)-like protein
MSSSNTMLGNLIVSDSCAIPAGAEWKHVIATACQLASLAIEHRRLFDQLDHLAYHDSLSGLLNRVALDAELQRAVDGARRTATTFAILCIDLDRFKQINDTLSHGTGDQFICAVASRLCEVVQSCGATVFRVGGDEFTVVLPVTTDMISAESLAKKILAHLRTPFVVGDRVLHTTASIGVSVFPLHGDTPAALQQAADSAMYKAKYAGKDQHKVFLPEWRVQENGYFEMEALLRTAIDSNWFEIHYQPKLDSMRRFTGLEALIRIRHPQLGLIAPIQFIAVAEDSGMIVQMGEWALDEVCRQIAAWRDQGISAPPVAVNVSAAQFARMDFDSKVRATLDRWHLPGSALELEITESLLMKNIAEATELMKKLRQIGITFAIDDFGTGYSSLGYLHSLPVSTVKIDRNFVNALGSTDDTCPIVNTIVQLARTLSLQVVAEGVETEDQFDMLRELGCDQFQGFLFSRPVPADSIQRLLFVDPAGDSDEGRLASDLSALTSAYCAMTPQVLMQ